MTQHFTTLIFALVLSLPTFLLGQGEFGLHVQHNLQLGELQQAGLNDGWGFSTELLSGPLQRESAPVNLQLGGRFDVSFAGNEETGLTYTSPYGNRFPIEVNNNNLGAYGVLRMSTKTWNRLQLYTEGMFGARWFYSSEGLGHPENVDEECPEFDGETLASNLTPSWGASAGFMVHVSPFMALDFRASYLNGNNVSFVDLSSIQVAEPGTYNYTLRSGVASQMMFQVGVNLFANQECENAVGRKLGLRRKKVKAPVAYDFTDKF